jgi:hypothetical protein
MFYRFSEKGFYFYPWIQDGVYRTLTFYLTSKDIFPSLDFKAQESFRNIYQFFSEYSNVKHYLNVDFFNIEELLSIIEMSHFLSEDENSKLKNDIIVFIKEVISKNTPPFIETEGKYKPYKLFLKNCLEIKEGVSIPFSRNNNSNSVISLNYDLLIENMLIEYNRLNLRKFEDARTFKFEYGNNIEYDLEAKYYNNPMKVEIAKLHGSLNFKNDIIIPPTWNKTNNPEIKSIWQLAFNLLSNANKIVFIGYSLPQTDAYLKYLLINAINKNENLKRIEVINPDDEKETTKNRYASFFEKSLETKAMFQYIPKKFEDWIEEIEKQNPKMVEIY